MTAFRQIGAALATATLQVRTWLLGWLLVTLPAVFLVWPLLRTLQQDFDHHPGATPTLGESLDLDFARQHPELALQGGGAVLLVLLGWTFLGGGILATVGRRPGVGLSEFLAAGGRALWPGLRVLGIGLLLAVLLSWGIAGVEHWLQVSLADVDPGAALTSSRFTTVAFGLELLHWLYGLGFLLLLFAAKVARAHLGVAGRSSALRAWLRAAASMLRHPLRALLMVLSLAALWLLSGWLFGILVAYGEASGRLWLMLLAAQLHVVVLQILLVANFLAARSLAGIEAAAEVPIEERTVAVETAAPAG